jgi:small conductance mechanosensitive channel
MTPFSRVCVYEKTLHEDGMQHITDFVPQFWSLALDQAINLLAAVVILCAGWMLANAAARWTLSGLAKVEHFDTTLKPLTASLIRYAILVFTVMAVLERFGVQTTSVIAVLGATGIAIGLALQGTLSNVASGVLLLLLRTFRVGDEINAGGVTGTVREIGLFRTTVISGDGLYVSLPNTTLFSGPIINNSREPTRLVSFKVTIDHSQDIGKAQEAALEVLHANRRVLKNPPPGASVAEIGEFEVTLAISAWTMTSDFGNATSELLKGVRDKFREAGIRTPQRLVSIGGGATAGAAAAAASEASEASRRKSA